jgi:hypothetical protein
LNSKGTSKLVIASLVMVDILTLGFSPGGPLISTAIVSITRTLLAGTSMLSKQLSVGGEIKQTTSSANPFRAGFALSVAVTGTVPETETVPDTGTGNGLAILTGSGCKPGGCATPSIETDSRPKPASTAARPRLALDVLVIGSLLLFGC